MNRVEQAVYDCMIPTAELLEQTTNPLHRAMLLNFWRHVHLEGAGDYERIVAPDMMVDQTFEAGWGPKGAVCVHHVRVKENVTLAQLEARFPQLRGRTGEICTEDFARQHGAIVFNRSRD